MTRSPVGRLAGVAKLNVTPAFGWFWTARTASLMGDYAFRVAFITNLIRTSNSPNVLAEATAVLLVPAIVFYIFGGAFGDRVRSRRAVLVGADLIRFVGTGAAAISVVLTDSPLPVVGFALLIGVGSGFFEPIAAGFMTQIVEKNRLVAANSALSVSRQVSLIIGPVLGGALVGLAGPAAAFWFDAATFAVSALALLAIPAAAIVRHRSEPDPAGGSAPAPAGGSALGQLWQEIVEGIRFIAGVRWLLITLATGAVANAVFAGGLDVLVPLVFSPHGGGSAIRLGLFYTLEGGGALIGALILSRLVVRKVSGGLFGMLALMALSLVLVGVFGNSIGSLLLALSYGVGMHFFNSLYPALVQTTVPAELISRVSSLEFLAFDGLLPIGILLMGPLSIGLGAGRALEVTGLVVVALSLATMAAPTIRALRFPVEGAAQLDESPVLEGQLPLADNPFGA
ncbi:MAG: MFS transporter [Actinomycetota bacterium]|nr:MFS transporter [Actinomycetota bacterium]MDQ2958256.1 MFS transporter [Actinomycetota bacterium]